MESAEREIHDLIKAHGGKLVRSKRHQVYKFPDGRCFTLPTSPSDRLWMHNCLRELRNFLGVNRPGRGAIGKRRERKIRAKAKRPSPIREIASQVKLPSMKDKLLKASGLDQLKRELEESSAEIKRRKYNRS